MKQQLLKIFSLFMAVLIATASVGLTKSSHHCLSSQMSVATQKKKSCCKPKMVVMTCCKESKSIFESINCSTKKSCCATILKSFSYTPDFVSKVVNFQVKLFSLNLIQLPFQNNIPQPKDFNLAFYNSTHPPPLISGREIITAYQLLLI